MEHMEFFSTKYIITIAIMVAIIKGNSYCKVVFTFIIYSKKINKGPKSVINFKNDLFTIMGE